MSLSLTLAALLAAKPARTATPTFNGDVAPIFYAKCVTCHRPGEIAPMSLITFEDARPWARAIQARVAAREMPPWFADPKYSHQFARDASLTGEQIQTIIQWVDAGAPRGDGTPPPVPASTDGWHRFKNRPPDAIVEMPTEFDVPSQGQLPVFTLWSPNPFSDDKFIEAVELRPSRTNVVHHSDVTARSLPPGTELGRGRAWKGGPPVDFVPVYADGRSYYELTSADDAGVPNALFRSGDDNRLLFYVPGGGFQQFPPGVVKRMSAVNALAWGLHYTPAGSPERDRERLGLWFAETPHQHEAITKRIGEAHIMEGKEVVVESGGDAFPTIPAFADDWRITAITPVQDDITVYGLWPHMHLRGKDMTFIVTYPDGREDVLLHVPRYDFRWQLQYELAQPVRIPAGSTIKAIGHYDNSVGNKHNPAPEKAVSWSEQSSDEMFNGWIEMSVDRHVTGGGAIYTLATPVNRRVSLGISGGPPGTVSVRNADGSIVTSRSIEPVASFIEPWPFEIGQTIKTEPSGAAAGNVTVTLFDVPPDVTGSIVIGGPAVTVATTQPGQNATLTFNGMQAQRVTVHVIGNTVGTVTVAVVRVDGAPTLSTVTASAFSFTVPEVTLPAGGSYSVNIDPQGMNVGRLNIALSTSHIVNR